MQGAEAIAELYILRTYKTSLIVLRPREYIFIPPSTFYLRDLPKHKVGHDKGIIGTQCSPGVLTLSHLQGSYSRASRVFLRCGSGNIYVYREEVIVHSVQLSHNSIVDNRGSLHVTIAQ